MFFPRQRPQNGLALAEFDKMHVLGGIAQAVGKVRATFKEEVTSMRLSVRGKNLTVTPALRTYAEKRLKRLERFIAVDHVQVVLSVEHQVDHVVEATLHVDGLLIRGEESSDSMYASIDLVSDKLERQIRKYRTRIGRRLHDALEASADFVETEEERLVRTKHFLAKPMSADEAIVQMNLLGHDFYAFVNADSEDINVVYRRRRGDYGLLIPER